MALAAGTNVPAWQTWADVVLQGEALMWRLGEGVAPRDLAGWYVTMADADRILSTLPGLNGADRLRVEALRAECEPDRQRARELLRVELDGPSRFAQLTRAAALTPSEAETLAVLAAVELSPQRQRLVAYLNDDVRLPRLTLALLDRLTDSAVCGPDQTLVRLGLVEMDGTDPFATRTVSIPSRVTWYLLGNDAADLDLPDHTSVHRGDGPRPEHDQGPTTTTGLVLVHGADRASRLSRTSSLFGGRSLLITTAPVTPGAATAIVRESVISQAVIVVELDQPLRPNQISWIEGAADRSWVLSSTRELPLESVPVLPWRELALTDGTADDADWEAFFDHVDPLDRPGTPGHPLDREQLRLVGTAMRSGELSLPAAVRRLAAGHLDGLALKVAPRCGWSDLVLPTDQLDQLRELASRHRNRSVVYSDWGFPTHPSAGIVALFAGESGTGKTLAAEVIAGDLGLDLYKVDLSSVVSKYIGETEKNLNRIFDAARACQVVLFFDEADALFGKRSEVNDAHDRYANIEVAYLLQRLEEHDGLVVMATNLRRNIDPAFVRRIAVSVDFSAPDTARRRSIWSHCFPPTAPVDNLDLDFLAESFAITGGMIHNAVVAAAFLAAEERAAIGMEHVVRALKREYQKAGRLQTEAEFDRYYPLVTHDERIIADPRNGREPRAAAAR